MVISRKGFWDNCCLSSREVELWPLPAPPAGWGGNCGWPVGIHGSGGGERTNSEYILGNGLSAIKGLCLTSRWNELTIFRWRRQEPERNKSRGFTGPPRPSCLRDVPPKLVNLF